MARTSRNAIPPPKSRGAVSRRGPSSREGPISDWTSVKRDKGPEERKTGTGESLVNRIWKVGGPFLYDLLGALIVLLIIIGALFTYTGNWPPLVVVQSGSMQHSDDVSSVGVIDTGDLVFVKMFGDDQIPISYVEGQKSDHRTYSSYGDVIIFRPNGDENKTAIIHRAVLWIEFNSTTYDNITRAGGSFDIPSLGLRDVTGQITLPNYEWPQKPGKMDLSIDIGAILRNFRRYGTTPHSGFVTKGDDNMGVDQTSEFFNPEPPWIEPVMNEWIIGKSVGELPWFGIIKLKFENNGHTNDIHPNSERNLWIALIIIVATPFAIDFLIHLVIRMVRRDRGEEATEERSDQDSSRRKEYIDLAEKKPTPRKAKMPPPRSK